MNSAWISWKSHILHVLFTFVPKSPRRKFRKTKPWFKSLHHHLRRRRDRLFAQARRNPSTTAWAAYRIARNAFNCALRKAKKEYFHDLSSDLNESPRGTYRWWQKAKSICHLNRSQATIPDLVHGSSTAKSVQEKAEMFANIFSSFVSAVNVPAPTGIPTCENVTPSSLLNQTPFNL